MSEVAITKMSSKGQIVVPKRLRELLGISSGEIFAMFGNDDTIVLKRLNVPSKNEFEALLKWGEEFAKRKKIKKVDVAKAIAESREKGG